MTSRVLLGVVLCAVSAATAYAECNYIVNFNLLDCKDQDPPLTAVPDNIPNTTVFLHLSGNAITEATASDFANLPKLYELDLTRNNIQGIALGTFEDHWANSAFSPTPSPLPFKLKMEGNPTVCELVEESAGKLECTCGGSAVAGPAVRTHCDVSTSTTTITSTTITSTTKTTVWATYPNSNSGTNTGGGTGGGDASSGVTAAPTVTAAPDNGGGGATDFVPSKQGWTVITSSDRGCCASESGQEYDWYEYAVDSLENCRLKCESEPSCRGVEFPWDEQAAPVCKLLMEDGNRPNSKDYSSMDSSATGLGPVTTQIRFCRPTAQCYQLCRAGDQGACLIQVVTEAPSIANGGSSVGRETIRVVFDAQIKSMVYYTGTGTPVDYTEFQADMSKVICDHSPASEKVKMCASDINVIVLNHLESANMTTAFDFLVNKGTTAISGADITDTLELGRIANPSSLFKFPIASFEYFSPTTASSSTVGSVEASASDSNFERDMAILGVCFVAGFLICLIIYMCVRVSDIKKMITQSQNGTLVPPGAQQQVYGSSPQPMPSQPGSPAAQQQLGNIGLSQMLSVADPMQAPAFNQSDMSPMSPMQQAQVQVQQRQTQPPQQSQFGVYGALPAQPSAPTSPMPQQSQFGVYGQLPYTAGAAPRQQQNQPPPPQQQQSAAPMAASTSAQPGAMMYFNQSNGQMSASPPQRNIDTPGGHSRTATVASEEEMMISHGIGESRWGTGRATPNIVEGNGAYGE